MKNLLTKEAFAEWCEKQPKSKPYDYMDNHGCAFCQYLNALGIEYTFVGGTYWATGGERRKIPSDMGDALSSHPRTFGALASRLRAS